MGEQPVACAPKKRPASLDEAERDEFAKALRILRMSEPPAMGTTTLSGRRQPSCSAIS
jgi:hypothetical protein